MIDLTGAVDLPVPTVYFPSSWVYSGVEVRQKSNPLDVRVITSIHYGSDPNSTVVHLYEESKTDGAAGKFEEVPYPMFSRDWEATGRHHSVVKAHNWEAVERYRRR